MAQRYGAQLLGAVTLIMLTAPWAAHAQCVGDCNDDGQVAINELIVGVNIALGASAVTSCPSFDTNSDESVAINELISAVNIALGSSCEGPTACGDGQMNVAGETCDDGNNVGGDGCAANCTTEIRRPTTLDPARARSTVQLATLAIPLTMSGTQALTTGSPRDTEVRGANGEVLFGIGEVPIVVKAEDVKFEPVPIFGLVCACVRGVAIEAFGPGISGRGLAGCGPQGLTNVDFLVEQDHNTTPGDPMNSGSEAGLPDDPECDDATDAGNDLTSTACKEGTGATCSEPSNAHTTACQSPRVITFSGGQAPRGSVLLYNSSAIGLLMDGATCAETRRPNGTCVYADYGPDCMPCTDDDLEKGNANLAPTTSGTASIALYDANNTKGVSLKEGATCGGTTQCVARVTGEVSDCDALIENPNAPLRGALVTAFPTLDAADTGDSIVTTTLATQR
jgi:cysteine-rich repeat protein